MQSLMKNIGAQVGIFDVFLLNWANEMVGKKFTSNVNSLFDQFTKTVHSIAAPFAFVETSLTPFVDSQSLAFVLTEGACVGISCCPFVGPVSMFLSIEEFAFIAFPDLKNKSSISMLHVIFPLPIVDISIFVLIGSSEAEIVAEGALEDISIEENEFPFDFLIIAPTSIVDRSFTEVVSPSSFLLPFLEVSHVFVLIDVFEVSLSMWQIIDKFSGVAAAFSVDHPSLAVFAIVMEEANIVVLADLIDMISISLSNSIAPFSFIELLLTVVNSISVFQVILPVSVVVGYTIIIEVDSSALHYSIIDQPIIDLPIGEDVDALSMEDIILPRAQIDIPTVICVNPLAFPQLGGIVDLPNEDASIRVVDFNNISHALESLQEFGFLEVVVANDLVFIIVLLISKGTYVRHPIQIIFFNNKNYFRVQMLLGEEKQNRQGKGNGGRFGSWDQLQYSQHIYKRMASQYSINHSTMGSSFCWPEG